MSYGALPDKAGRFLRSQAKDHETTVQAILQLNPGIVKANKIVPGDVIRIPPRFVGGELGAIRACKDEYVAKEGDTIKSIAKMYNTWQRKIKAVNPEIAESSIIKPGQIIRIPPSDGSGLCALRADKEKYSVRIDDTLYLIGVWNGLSVDELAQANPDITNPDLIYPRQIIRIPKK